MLPSTQSAGFSLASPVAKFVTVTTQISRPSWLLPMLSTRIRLWMFFGERLNQPRQVVVAIELVESYLRHVYLFLLLLVAASTGSGCSTSSPFPHRGHSLGD